MSIIVTHQRGQKEAVQMRTAYCQTLMELAEENPDIVVLDADLMNSMGMMPFQQKFPERTFDVGIQEANMIGIAAGLSATGKIPFAHSFAPFATRRAYDQDFLSAAYARLNVRITGSDPGVTAAFNGGTHMPFEDVGIMRNIPGITILEPADCTMLRQLIRDIAGRYGVFYTRLLRKNAVKVYEEGSVFEIGKAALLREGRDAAVIATGILVDEALKAADMLAQEGISIRVLNMFTIKPVDKQAVIAAARETGAIVTAENHNVINGLGSAVAEVLAEHHPAPMERIGVADQFGQVGPESYLREAYHLTAQDIVSKVKKAIARKEG